MTDTEVKKAINELHQCLKKPRQWTWGNVLAILLPVSGVIFGYGVIHERLDTAIAAQQRLDVEKLDTTIFNEYQKAMLLRFDDAIRRMEETNKHLAEIQRQVSRPTSER